MKFTLLKRRKSVTVKNNIEFVTWMRNNDRQQWENNEEFMQGYSYRKSTFEETQIDHENEDKFVSSLQQANLLKIENRSNNFLSFLKKQP